MYHMHSIDINRIYLVITKSQN